MFNRVCIVGVGLLGGSLARDINRLGLAEEVIGVTRSQSSAQKALDLKVVDKVLELEEAVLGADLIVIATPMQTMLPILEQMAGSVSPEAIITDVGSVKTDLYAKLKHELPELLPQFVLAHPISGGENSGVEASVDGLFEGKHVIMTSCAEEDDAAVERVRQLWCAVGAKMVTMSLAEHDAIFAKTSHLPHVVAFSLVNYLNSQHNREQLFDLAAAGFYDFTRIASSDAEMWRDICITNQEQVLAALGGYIQQLETIKADIERLDQSAVLHYFKTAKQTRDLGLSKK